MDKELLHELDRILNKINNIIENKPNIKDSKILFEPVQELGWAVDKLLGRHKKTTNE